MGDNYCDAINNRAFCNYDGGDCCHSTVKTKMVSVCSVKIICFSHFKVGYYLAILRLSYIRKKLEL